MAQARLTLQAVINGVKSDLIKGLHRVVGFVDTSTVLVLKIEPATMGPSPIEYDKLAKEIALGHITYADEPELRGVKAELSGGDKEHPVFKRGKDILRQIVPRHETDQSWLMSDRLQVLINLCASKLGIKRLTVARTMYRWLETARKDGGLLPRHQTGAGTREVKEGSKKRGRKYEAGHFDATKEAYSLTVTPTVRDKIRQGIDTFYDPARRNFAISYELTIGTYFSTTDRGKKRREKSIPSPDQYRYQINKMNEDKGLLKSKLDSATFGKEHRGTGAGALEVAGATLVYEIDATFPAIDIVCEFDPTKVLGTATVYLVLDVHTGTVVGDFETYKPASLDAARSALFYTFTEKAEDYKRCGVILKPGEFDCNYVSHQLSSDKGELRGKDAEYFIEGMGFRMTTVIAERADLKGTVEACNALLETEGLSLAPGYRRKRTQYGNPAMTLNGLRTATKRIILRINSRAAKFVPVGAKLRKDGRFTRMDHFYWSVENTRGAGRVLPEKDIYMSLLPKREITVTREGILWEGNTFSSNELLRSNITAVGMRETTKKWVAAVEEGDISRIWLPHPNRKDIHFELSNNDPRIRKQRAALEEAIELLKRDQHVGVATKVATLQRRTDLATANNDLYKENRQRAAAAHRLKGKVPEKPALMSDREMNAAVDAAQELMNRQQSAGLERPESVKEEVQKMTELDDLIARKKKKLAEQLRASQ